ncbi:hypothetical protein [Fusobacterium ulcerans]|nr:hypothetical protein [Fusobacterium ulcerans]MEE0138329.1 hypothetical protein [Fusobacterium ulcerans]
MIIDKIENISFYEGMVKNLSVAVKTLGEFKTFETRRYEYDRI